MQAKFNDLPHYKKQEFLTELVHAIQSDDTFFHYTEIIVGIAKRRGLFDRVKIFSETEFAKREINN